MPKNETRDNPDEAGPGENGAATAPSADTAGKNPVEPSTPAVTTEIGGRGGADPTRYGDWEINGRCVDF